MESDEEGIRIFKTPYFMNTLFLVNTCAVKNYFSNRKILPSFLV